MDTSVLCWAPRSPHHPLPIALRPQEPSFLRYWRTPGRHLLCPGPTSQISPTAAVRGWSPGARFAPFFSSAFSSSCSDKSTTTFCTSFSPGTLTAATQKHKSGVSKLPLRDLPLFLRIQKIHGRKIFLKPRGESLKEMNPGPARCLEPFRTLRERGRGRAGRELCVTPAHRETGPQLTLDSFGPKLNASKLGDHGTSAGETGGWLAHTPSTLQMHCPLPS